MLVYLTDVSALSTVRAATPRQKWLTKLSMSPSHSILTPNQPVPALSPSHQVPVPYTMHYFTPQRDKGWSDQDSLFSQVYARKKTEDPKPIPFQTMIARHSGRTNCRSNEDDGDDDEDDDDDVDVLSTMMQLYPSVPFTRIPCNSNSDIKLYQHHQ